jgi:hypothetical protein
MGLLCGISDSELARPRLRAASRKPAPINRSRELTLRPDDRGIARFF